MRLLFPHAGSRAAALVVALAVLSACDKSETAAADGTAATETVAAVAAAAPQVVDVSAGDFYYTMPDTLSAGATTFRLTTTGQELHQRSTSRRVPTPPCASSRRPTAWSMWPKA